MCRARLPIIRQLTNHEKCKRKNKADMGVVTQGFPRSLREPHILPRLVLVSCLPRSEAPRLETHRAGVLLFPGERTNPVSRPRAEKKVEKREIQDYRTESSAAANRLREYQFPGF